MKRIALVLALSWPLGGCFSFGGLPSLSRRQTPPAAAPAPPAVQCPGGLRADLQAQPKLPETAGFPEPVSEAERTAVADYLMWLSQFSAWGRAGWQRAGEAKTYCDGAAKR